jgi:FtsH-binding integral membrane protein
MTFPTYTDRSEARPAGAVAAAFLTHAFLWMFAGLLLTAGVAFFVQGSQTLLTFALDNYLILLVAQIVVVFAISLGIGRIGATAALGLFFVYAASLGLTIGLIVTAYTGASVVSAFLSSAAMFGGAAIYGATTKRSLAGIGGILTMGIIGLIAALLINGFLLHSTGFDLAISVVGVLLFTALTAYDVQRISVGSLVAATGSVEKAAVIGALRLYLDFVNLFLMMLRLLGDRR